MLPKLFVFPISHFSEKARWAWEISGQPFQLEILRPGFHYEVIRCLAPESSVPVLQLNSETSIQGSSKILDQVEELVFGAKSTESERQKEAELDNSLGKGLQTILYSFILEEPEIVGKLFSSNPIPKDALGEIPENFDFLAVALRRRYRISTKNVDSAKESFSKSIQELGQIYQEREYFSGGRFGRVDLTVAALTGAILQPEHHPANPWFDSVSLPESMQSFFQQESFQPLWKRVRELYKNHRKKP